LSEFLPNASIPRRYAEEGASISINAFKPTVPPSAGPRLHGRRIRVEGLGLTCE
jgi:hypothetical protein